MNISDFNISYCVIVFSNLIRIKVELEKDILFLLNRHISSVNTL